MSATRDYPVIRFSDQSAFAAWLEEHHATEPGVWVQLSRVTSGVRSITRDQALDVALCYGWIDGQGRSYDADSWLQKFTPRGRRSVWSKRNREHVARLIASGEMQPAGMAAIEAARADGRWDRAYDSPSTATVPADLQVALDADPEARAFFATLKSAHRYAILHRIQTAVKAETRARRIAQFVAMLGRKETL